MSYWKIDKMVLILAIMLFPICAQTDIIMNGSLSHVHQTDPGITYKDQILVNNTGNKKVEVKVYQTDYRFYANGDNFYDETGTIKRSNANWIKFSPQIFIMEGNTERTIYYTVSVPQKLENKNSTTPFSGSYWSLIMIESRPVDEVDIKINHSQLDISAIMRYGVQIVTNIGSSGQKNLIFNNSRLLKENNNLFLQFDIENNGDQLLIPNVWLELYNSNGESVGNFNTDPKRTFPDTSIRHTIKLDNVPNGDYKALIIADCGEDNLFGHQLTLNIK